MARKELHAALLSIDRDAGGLLAQTPQWKVRKGSYCGTPVCVRSLRASATKRQLGEDAREVLAARVEPFPHPNLDQPLGVVVSTLSPDARPVEGEGPVVEHVVTACYATSLFDVLHRDGMVLSRDDVAFVSVQVLRALSFLHQHDETLGVCLTSRRVMLDAVGSVRLRRFGSELLTRHRAATTSCRVQGLAALGTHRTLYAMAANPDDADASGLSSKARDLFAFGVLLLEMCTGEKPTSELVNKVSRSRQLDPVFYAMVRSALALGGLDGLPPPLELGGDCSTRLLPGEDSESVCADSLLALLASRYPVDGSGSVDRVEPTSRSSVAFPSFLHADRHFAAQARQQVEAALKERSSHADVMVRRLGAVEQELVDEQRNFEVLVQQLELLQRDKAAVERANERLRALVQGLHDRMKREGERLEAVAMRSEEQAARLQLADERAQDEQRRAHVLDREKLQAMRENQQLRVELLQVQDGKARQLELTRDAEREREQLRGQVGRERETLDDLQGRLEQAIHRWREEQSARRRLETQAEAASKQLQQLEDERCRYAQALWRSPTRGLDAKEAPAAVIALKDRQVQHLADQLDAARTVEKELQARVELVRAEARAAQVERQALAERLEALQEEARALEGVVSACDSEKRALRHETELTRAEIAALKQQVGRLEQRLEQQAEATKAAESARRLRQCLTPNCDAPKVLVGASGYCQECEERARRTPASVVASKQRHRRQRSLDSASSPRFAPHECIRSSKRNAEVVRIVRAMEAPPRGEEYASLTEVEAAERDERQRLDGLKQLAALLKTDDALKDDLPECEAVRVVLALMHEYRASAGFQLEACRFVSLSVFSHDRNRVLVAAEGAVGLLLAAMMRFGSDLKLQEACCVALTNLAHNCEANRKRILASGGVDAVLRLMQTQPKTASVQKRCCWALLTLAGSDDMCEGIAARGGVGAVLAAMLNCPASDDVQHYGSWALLNLVSGTSALQQFARREGVVEVVEAARACFPDHAGIQEKTRDVLDVFCC